MKIIVIISLFQITCFSQYSSKDRDLVLTTYTRQFNQNIEERYLNSRNENKVNAALLSLAQSEDTSWVNKILELNFGQHSKYICFTLGELGESFQSASFLLSKFSQTDNSVEEIHCELETLGKVGNINTYNFLIGSYSQNNQNKFDGISLALYNFYFRKIGNKDKAISILSNELIKSKFPGRRNFEAAFALYRIGSTPEINKVIIDELHSYYNDKDLAQPQNKYTEITIPYLLGCLQLNKFFPEDSELFKSLIQSNNYSIKIAAIKALVFYPFINKNDLESFLALLKDSNQNVSMELASSIKYLKLNDTLKLYLKNYLVKGIKGPIYSPNTRGEMFLSYLKLFNPNFENIKHKYEHNIPKKYFYQACENYNNSEKALKYLLTNFSNTNEKSKISILESALNFQKNMASNKRLDQLLINSLISSSPALISIAADGIDSLYILQNRDKLKSIIIRQVVIHKNDPDYLESLMSLSNLAEKIDKKLSGKVLKNLSNSTEFSIKIFAYKQLGLSVQYLVKSDNYFNYFWDNAFKYKYAEISTIKGTFKIELLPQYAPVSVGNFCYLAKKKFFNKNIFHRVVPGFVIQGGDPEETGWGGPGYDIISEFSPLNYDRGMVGMASAGKDTEGSQWFVTNGAFPHLNGRYTIFAKTIKDINVVDNIAQGDSILKINFLP